jgi:hypothetical protein
MPRPIKTGLDYFYTDVHEMDQREMIHLLNQYGPLGYSIFQVIRCMIYENGYYLEDSMDSVAMVVTRTIGNRWIKDKSFVEKVINYCAELGLLDNDLLRKGVFTSKAIQLAYQAVTARSKADKTKYWLLADPASDPEAFFVRNRVYGSQKKGAAAAGRSLSPKGVSVEETPVSAQKTQVNPLSMHERKENKTKRDKSKAEESKGKTSPDSQRNRGSAAAADHTEEAVNSAEEFLQAQYSDEFFQENNSPSDSDEYDCEDYSLSDSFDYPGESSGGGSPEREYIAATGRKFTRADRTILSKMHSLGASDRLIAEVIREVGERGENEIRSLRYFMPIVEEALRPAKSSSRSASRGRSGMCEETSTVEDIEAVLNAEWESQLNSMDLTGTYTYDD